MAVSLDQSNWNSSIRTGNWTAILLGVVTITAFGLGFAYWAATAPISGAAVASGIIVAEDRNIQVQHLEGGIVLSVEAREGDRVTAGSPLVTLDRRLAEASLARLQSRLMVLRAQQARLSAQRDDAETITFPETLNDREEDREVAVLVENQRAEYYARRARYLSETAILNERIGALERETAGLQAQLTAAREQLAIVEEEIGVVSGLFEKELVSAGRLLALRRSAAEFRGMIGDVAARIAATDNKITEVREQMVGAETGRLEETLKGLTSVRSEIVDLEGQLVAAADVVKRIIVSAPLAGTLVKLHVTTPGSVIAPGGLIAEILPRDARRLVEVQLMPQDIDVIQLGQEAHLRLSALNQRTTPNIEAKVTYISADRLIDANSRESYYSVRLAMVEPLPNPITWTDLHPGMQVEVFISTGERTFFAYLVKPIMDSFARAFKES